MLRATIKVNRAGLDNIKRKLNTLKNDLTDREFFTNLGFDMIEIMQKNAPYDTGDTMRNITLALATKKQLRLQSTSTDISFPDKHLWINAYPGHERTAWHGKTYAEVAKTGNPSGYWNVMLYKAPNLIGDSIISRLTRIINM